MRISKLIDRYVAALDALSDKEVVEMTKEAANIDADRVKSLEILINTLKSDLTGRQMSRLMQGELKMNAVTDLVLAAAIPVAF